MNETLIINPEPALEFRYSQRLCDPRDGLSIFGPYDTDEPSHPQNISYAVIGTIKGLELFGKFASRIQSPIAQEPNEKAKLLWPAFPGFEAAFHSSWSNKATRCFTLNRNELVKCARDKDPDKRTWFVVETYISAVERILQHEEIVSVIICVVPDIIYKNCRPESRIQDGTGVSISRSERKLRKSGRRDLFDSYDPEQYQYSVDFRRQIKARAMKHGVPIQIIRESTLRLTEPTKENPRGLTPLSDRAWNLGVAIYYKAGGKPWRLSTAREGVCYIGIAYRLTGTKIGSKSACCAAQMFLDTGDGIVFMGERGRWYSPEKREFHLSRKAARNLLAGVLKSYVELEGKPLSEIFLHCRSAIDSEEFSGFKEACPCGVKLLGIRVRPESRGGIRLFREGTRPVLRGTFWKIHENRGFLWTTGYKPRLGTYDGWETPVPLQIDIQHGNGAIEQVATDILGLTKLNYNACRLGESEPVTVGFSSAVGEILVSNPTVRDVSHKFKFYI